METAVNADQAVKVMVVDDHPVIRFGLRHMLAAEPGIALIKDVEGIDELIEAVRDTVPDVVILDLELRDSNGVQALQQLRKITPDTRVLIYTAHVEDAYILEVAELGINGYLLKGCPMHELAAAIRSINAGGTVLDPTVAGRLVSQMGRRARTAGDSKDTTQLSEREIEVLSCLAKGKSNRAIAEMLYICEATVKFHVHAILGKLRASNRTEAVTIGVKRGLISLEARH